MQGKMQERECVEARGSAEERKDEGHGTGEGKGGGGTSSSSDNGKGRYIRVVLTCY